jgi:hypothetical protein
MSALQGLDLKLAAIVRDNSPFFFGAKLAAFAAGIGLRIAATCAVNAFILDALNAKGLLAGQLAFTHSNNPVGMQKVVSLL